MDRSVNLRERAFDEFPEPIAILDSQAQSIDTNQAWNEVIREASADFLPASSQENFISKLSQSSKDGTTKVAEEIRSVLENSEKSVTEYHPFDGTITDRRFLLRIIGFTHKNDRWALIVLVDVSDIDEEALTARERARRAEAALSIVAHDLRTPLNVVEGYAELLQDELDTAKQPLEQIQSASARANTIIDDALTLLQGCSVTEREEVDLRSVAEDVWDDLGRLTEDASLKVTESFRFEAEPGLLRRMFENLFVNAIDHAGPQVTVRVGRLPESESSTVGFFVEDDGPGLPDSEVEQIFTPGYTSGSGGGYGLGLMIVQTIIKGHGWSIAATNGENGGARFEVSGIHPVSG